MGASSAAGNGFKNQPNKEYLVLSLVTARTACSRGIVKERRVLNLGTIGLGLSSAILSVITNLIITSFIQINEGTTVFFSEVSR